ncbi:sugar kinase [Herbidospora mongoliensis]|uniref:sugar kinase n=1 Tax=Herbidospora mongoliensis TaxID=688067 RepID=UPI00082B9155|nr:sugar kinase [Herbidospora mongoliensis]
MTDLFTLGEVLGVVTADRIRHDMSARLDLEGPELTVAVGLARLGHSVAYVGRVSDDEVGIRTSTVLRGEGVDVSHVKVDETAASGLALRQRRIGRVAHAVFYREGSAGSRLSTGDVPTAVQDARILHVTGITPALSGYAWSAVHHAVKLAKDAGVLVSVDVNHRATLWDSVNEARQGLRELAGSADILFANQDELDLVEPALAQVPELVVTRGSKGASATVEGFRYDTQAAPVTVVDATEVGGAFVAGYLSAVLDGVHPSDRLKRGIAVAAFAVASHSTWQGLPNRSELPP